MSVVGSVFDLRWRQQFEGGLLLEDLRAVGWSARCGACGLERGACGVERCVLALEPEGS
jgi:hypothetical protein